MTELWLSQAKADTLCNDVVDAQCMVDDRLAWLSDYYLCTKLDLAVGE